MSRGRALRERFDLAWLADIEPMHADFPRLGFSAVGFGDLRRDRLQPGFVTIGEREIAAARRKFKRQRPANTTGGAGHGGGSTDRSHLLSAPSFEILRGKPYTA